jgi:hypothetical protein
VKTKFEDRDLVGKSELHIQFIKSLTLNRTVKMEVLGQSLVLRMRKVVFISEILSWKTFIL